MIAWDETFSASEESVAADGLDPIALPEVYRFIDVAEGEERVYEELRSYRRTVFVRTTWPLLIYGAVLGIIHWQAFLRATGGVLVLLIVSSLIGVMVRHRRDLSSLSLWILLGHPVLVYGLVLGVLNPRLFLHLTGMILLLMVGSGAAYGLNHRTERQELLEKSRSLSHYRPLLEEAKWFNATLNYLRVDDRMVEIGNPSQLQDKERFTQYLKDIRSHLVRAIKTQRLLIDHPHFRSITKARQIPTASHDVLERASEYSKSINDVLEVDLSAYLEAKEKLWQIQS